MNPQRPTQSQSPPPPITEMDQWNEGETQNIISLFSVRLLACADTRTCEIILRPQTCWQQWTHINYSPAVLAGRQHRGAEIRRLLAAGNFKIHIPLRMLMENILLRHPVLLTSAVCCSLLAFFLGDQVQRQQNLSLFNQSWATFWRLCLRVRDEKS